MIHQNMLFLQQAFRDGQQIFSEVKRKDIQETVITHATVYGKTPLKVEELIERWNTVGQLGIVKWKYTLIKTF